MHVSTRPYYAAPRKAILQAAERIVNGAEIMSVMETWMPVVANNRMRRKLGRTATSAADMHDQEVFEAEYDRAVDETWVKVEELVAAEKKNPLKHLNVKPGAERAWDRFNRALREASESGVNLPNCHGKPELYSDYDDDSIPTEEEAYALCFSCPLIELCAQFAEEEQPAHGIWAGEVFSAERS